MPTQFKKVFDSFPAVLIREETANEYGKEIRTASEYIDLLMWLKAQYQESMPGTAIPCFQPRKNIVLDFFMPDQGYWSVFGNWEWYVTSIGSNDTRVSYPMPEIRIAIERFIDLWRDEFLYGGQMPVF
jgi:hypothetical protein